MEALRRHTIQQYCPICGGHVGLRQGQGTRCAGFTLDRVSYCTRPEHAGRLPLDITLSPPAYKHQLFGECPCGMQHGWSAVHPTSVAQRPKRESLPIDERHEIYGFALDNLRLSVEARTDLMNRGLSGEAAVALGYRSIPRRGNELTAFLRTMKERLGEAALRQCPGFTDKNGRLTFWSATGLRDGYIVPYRDAEGRITGLQLKLLGGKYKTARGSVLTGVYHLAGAVREGGDLVLTEGATKAIVTHHVSGVSVFAVAGQSLAAEHIDVIASLRPGRVIVALDEENNPQTDQARERWLRALFDAGLAAYRATWEAADAKGIDDLVVLGGRPRIRRATFVPSEISKRRVPREAPETGEISGGTDLASVRDQTRAAVRDFIASAEHHAGAALLVSTPPGTGKTTATAAALSAANVHGRIVVGTTRLACELAGEFGYTLIEGRNEENCERFDVVQALAADGHDVEELACGTHKEPRCPSRETCDYYGQFAQVGTRVAAAEQIFNPRFLRGGGVVVADDADLSRSLIERTRLSPDALARCHRLLRKRRRKPARDVVALVHHAVVDAPPRPLIGAPVWDHLARTAKKNGTDLAALVASLPIEPTVPPPEGDRHGVLTTKDVEGSPPASVLPLLKALREELPSFLSGEDFNSRIRLGSAGVDVWALRAPAKDRYGCPMIAEKPLLVLEATPVPSLVERLTQLHDRLSDVGAAIPLPANVTVVQYASASNGLTILRDQDRLRAVLAEVSADRELAPKEASKEAAVCFLVNRSAVLDLGFAPEQVLTFGSARGSNAIATVERLHVIGRPMPPAHDLAFLAQVIHHDEEAVSEQLTLTARRFGGQRYEVEVVDFEDGRVAELLKSARDDELVQVLHRARLLTLDPQSVMFDGGRREVRLVLHTGHVIPGLRIDELHLTSSRRDVNAERSEDAARRVLDAVERLQANGQPITVTAIARESSSHKRTVARVLGTPVHTLRDLSNKGMHHIPQTDGLPDSSLSFEAAAAGGGGG